MTPDQVDGRPDHSAKRRAAPPQSPTASRDPAAHDEHTAAVADSTTVLAPLSGLRAWFVLYLLWLIALTSLSQFYFGRYEDGDLDARGPWLLAEMCFYLSLCNLFMPLPTSWIVLLVASNDIALLTNPYARIALVGLTGAVGTMMANLNEYHVLGYFFRARLGARIRRTRAYRWSVRWFDVSPFRVLVLVSFVPIPIDVVRWIAILRRYPRPRFAAAYFLGRAFRYALLAAVSVALSLTTWQIVLIQVGLVVLLAARLLWAMIRRALGWGPPPETKDS